MTIKKKGCNEILIGNWIGTWYGRILVAPGAEKLLDQKLDLADKTCQAGFIYFATREEVYGSQIYEERS